MRHTYNSGNFSNMPCWIVTVWYSSTAYRYIVRDSMFCRWIVPQYCSNAWHNVATVRHTNNSGSSDHMLCYIVTVCYNCATWCSIVPESMLCCLTFPPLWSINDFLTACVDRYAMLLHFATLYSNPDIMFRWMTTMFKHGVKFNMMAGPFAISPFSPCARSLRCMAEGSATSVANRHIPGRSGHHERIVVFNFRTMP
jgi:hypothetical protein